MYISVPSAVLYWTVNPSDRIGHRMTSTFHVFCPCVRKFTFSFHYGLGGGHGKLLQKFYSTFTVYGGPLGMLYLVQMNVSDAFLPIDSDCVHR